MDSAPPQDARWAAVAIAAVLLTVFPRLGWSAADPSDRPDWRADARFVEASEAVATWLSACPEGDRALRVWRDAIDTAPRAARLAEPLRQVAGEYGEQVASLMTTPPPTPPDWLASIGDAEASIRLAVAEGFATRGDYDACLAWSDGLTEKATFSPALLHYLRAVAAQQTVSDEPAAAELKRFEALETEASETLGPARRWVLAALRQASEEKPKPLPVVVRRMRDVERRLAISQPGDETEKLQQTILDELDELLKKLEEQQKQQQQQASQAGGSGNAAPTNPAETSRPSELKGPGEVDRKRLVAGDAWGSLPPAERERLTQSITQDFPPHYRGLIEDYFKTLAAEADAPSPNDR